MHRRQVRERHVILLVWSARVNRVDLGGEGVALHFHNRLLLLELLKLGRLFPDDELELLILLRSLLNLIISSNGFLDRLGEVAVELLLLVLTRVVALDLAAFASLDWSWLARLECGNGFIQVWPRLSALVLRVRQLVAAVDPLLLC